MPRKWSLPTLGLLITIFTYLLYLTIIDEDSQYLPSFDDEAFEETTTPKATTTTTKATTTAKPERCPSYSETMEAAARRKKRMLEACRENEDLLAKSESVLKKNYAERREFFRSVKLKVVYMEIAKNGHTNILNYLTNWGSDDEMRKLANSTREQRLKVYSRLSGRKKGNDFGRKSGMCKTKEWRDYYKFVFIRDPLERIVSTWHERYFDNPQPKREDILKYVRANRAHAKQMKDNDIMKNEPRPTLTEIFNFIAHFEDPSKNVHWKPQVWYYPFCDPDYFDFIGTTDTMVCDMEAIAQRFSGLDKVPAMIADAKPKRANKDRHEQLRAVPPKLARELIEKYYLLDYKILGFQMPDFDNWNASIEEHW